MRKINSFLCIAVLCCAGCATSGTELVKEGEQLLSKSTNIVSSVAKFTYQPTSIGEPLKFEFGEQTSILLAGNERRFAKGFVLPANNNSYSVHITSFRQ